MLDFFGNSDEALDQVVGRYDEFITDAVTSITGLTKEQLESMGIDIADLVPENIKQHYAKAIEEAKKALEQANAQTAVTEANEAWESVEQKKQEIERLKHEIEKNENILNNPSSWDFLTGQYKQAERNLFRGGGWFDKSGGLYAQLEAAEAELAEMTGHAQELEDALEDSGAALQEVLTGENGIVPEEPVELPVIPVLPEGTDLISDIFGPDPGVELVFAINEESFEQPVPAPDMSPVVDAVDQARKDVTDDVNEMLRQMERLKTLGFSYDAIFRGGAGGSRFNTYSMFADGGFVGNGDLFMAREAGPELVGRIGSRTAVANNDQIVAGVAGGVAAGQAEQNALLRQQNDLLRQMVAKSGRVEAVPSSDWGRFIQRSSQMYANNTGA